MTKKSLISFNKEGFERENRGREGGREGGAVRASRGIFSHYGKHNQS